jgi:uncharacterized membrane protein
MSWITRLKLTHYRRCAAAARRREHVYLDQAQLNIRYAREQAENANRYQARWHALSAKILDSAGATKMAEVHRERVLEYWAHMATRGDEDDRPRQIATAIEAAKKDDK